MEALAPDKGLYMPLRRYQKCLRLHFLRGFILDFPWTLWNWPNIGWWAVEASALKKITETAFDFPVVLHEVSKGIYSLGIVARTIACLQRFWCQIYGRAHGLFQWKTEKPLTILVATSGDTLWGCGCRFLMLRALKSSFYILRARSLTCRKKQLTTLGKNITACEIKGSFDDCQALVKEVFGWWAKSIINSAQPTPSTLPVLFPRVLLFRSLPSMAGQWQMGKVYHREILETLQPVSMAKNGIAYSSFYCRYQFKSCVARLPGDRQVWSPSFSVYA